MPISLPADVHPSIHEVGQLLASQGLTYLGKLTCSQFSQVEVYAYATPNQGIAVSVMAGESGLSGIDCVSKFADDSFLTTTTVQVLHNAYDEQRLFRISLPGLNAIELLEQHLAYVQDFEQRYGAVQAIVADLLAIAKIVDEYTIRQQSNPGHGWLQFTNTFAQTGVAQMMAANADEEEDDDDEEYDEEQIEEETGLAIAIRQNNLPMLQMLLEAGADPNAGMEDNYRVIMLAALHGRLEMVQLLVAHGADVNAWSQGETAIMSAAREAHQAVYDYLYPLLDAETRRYTDKHGQKEIEKAIKRKARKANKLAEKLGDAAMYGRLAKVQQLLAEGADPNAITECGKSPLMLAAMYGHKDAIAALLDAGADPNLGSDEEFEEGMTALMYIASSFFASNRAEVIKFLIERGADVNARNAKGQTALIAAGENADAVKALIAAGADVNLRDDEGNTAMMSGTWAIQQLLRQAGASQEGLNDVALVEAVREGNLMKLEELLQAGANVNYGDGSALVAAAGKRNLALVDRLIQAEADVNLGWKTGFTPIARAAYEGYLDVVERLISAGADPFQRTHDDEFYDALDYARLGQAEGHHAGKDHAAIIELLTRQQR